MPSLYIRRNGQRNPQIGNRTIKFPVPNWVDPYFSIQGSEPEKMVMAEFVRRGIYFQHTPQANTLGGLVDPTWEADFWLIPPQYKIWIEVNGLYFHTLPGSPERDAYRYAVLTSVGIKVIVWWDFDILARLPDLMNQEPEFYWVDPKLQHGKTNEGLPFYEGGFDAAGNTIDHLKGLRKALSGRATSYTQAAKIKSRSRTIRKPK